MAHIQTYSEFAPTCFDSKGAFLPDRQDWLVVPVGRNRDSEPLDESNFEAALAMLGGESNSVEVHRFEHWGPGWFEIILVNPKHAAMVAFIADKLENYPVLNEDDLSEREFEAATESWDNWGRGEFKRRLRKAYPDLEDTIDELTDDAIDKLAHDDNFASGSIPYYESGSDGPSFPCLYDKAPLPDREDIAPSETDKPFPDHPGQTHINFDTNPGKET